MAYLASDLLKNQANLAVDAAANDDNDDHDLDDNDDHDKQYTSMSMEKNTSNSPSIYSIYCNRKEPKSRFSRHISAPACIRLIVFLFADFHSYYFCFFLPAERTNQY